jgi:NAD(P)-dependent dehydrogenase (short-subunit alcohol dehydrogenase family)
MPSFTADRLALVTGAAGDIGRAVAFRLASDGASLVLVDLPGAAERLDETRRLCEPVLATGADVTTTLFDVTDAEAVRAAIASVNRNVGIPELVFNNAGYQGQFANIVDVDLSDVGQVLAVNVGGVFSVLQTASIAMRDAGRQGAIVNTASMAGVSGAPNMAAYSASKAAVIALTKSAAKDLAPVGIRVNAVSPGFIGPGAMWDNQVKRQAEVASPYFTDTEDDVAAQMLGMIPLGRYGGVDEVAEVIEFLLSDRASYLTGINIEIAGGSV